MEVTQIKYFVEAALLAAGRPLSIDQLQKLFDDDSMPEKAEIRQAISELSADYEERGLSVTEVASGFRIQIDPTMTERLQKLWEERPPRYSRALFETLALIAYRQPMTRGEIEEIRGVSVSSNIIRSLLEREWVRVVGHRDVPGRPAMFGTTKQFLDYFGLKKLEDLPPLADLSDWESLRVQLDLPAVEGDEGSVDEDLEGELAAVETAEVTEIPVVNATAGPASETSESEELDTSVDNLAADEEDTVPLTSEPEPIQATKWPDPNESNNPAPGVDAESDEARNQEDTDTSLTGG